MAWRWQRSVRPPVEADHERGRRGDAWVLVVERPPQVKQGLLREARGSGRVPRRQRFRRL